MLVLSCNFLKGYLFNAHRNEVVVLCFMKRSIHISSLHKSNGCCFIAKHKISNLFLFAMKRKYACAFASIICTVKRQLM